MNKNTRNHQHLIDRLTEQMAINLQKKEALGYPSWLDEEPKTLMEWLGKECLEFFTELSRGNPKRAWEEAADVANIVAMLADFLEKEPEKFLGIHKFASQGRNNDSLTPRELW